jgi:hypothetical protein
MNQPRNETHREIIIRVRLNSTEYATLVKLAATKGTTHAAILRHALYRDNSK